MVNFQTYTIGRTRDCEIPIDDGSVSRRHAELVVARSGNMILTDCASTHGTFVDKDGGWQPIRQTPVTRNQRVKFGSYETTIAAILPAAKNRPLSPSSTPTPDDNRPQGPVRRDATTGEIIAKNQ